MRRERALTAERIWTGKVPGRDARETRIPGRQVTASIRDATNRRSAVPQVPERIRTAFKIVGRFALEANNQPTNATWIVTGDVPSFANEVLDRLAILGLEFGIEADVLNFKHGIPAS